MLSRLLRSSLQSCLTPPRHWRFSCCCLAACFVYSACAVETVDAQSWQKATTASAGPRPSVQPQVRLAPSAAAAAVTTPFPLANTFKLHSRPQAAMRIYLDFDGNVTQGTPWNGTVAPWTDIAPKIWTSAFSLDADPAFTDVELAAIQNMWQRVSEGFSPFHVDVTTEQPPVSDLINTGAGDARWGVRVAIGDSYPSPAAGAGGVSFVGAFGAQVGTGQDIPCFAFSSAQGNDNFVIGYTCVHETGHTLGLLHDGSLQAGPYYPGHGSGPTGWAPFMGAGFTKSLIQWSQDDYFLGNNFEDDLLIITTQNGFTYRADDHANSLTTATAIAGTANATVFNINQSGVIERRTDTDWFKIVAKTGTLNLSAVGGPVQTMLDIQMDLYDANGLLIVSNNPSDDVTAAITKSVVGGTYYVKIDGVGIPGAAINFGYTDYGSLGQYTLTGSFVAGSSPPPASNVIATYSAASKTLTVTGDTLANSVSIVRDGLNLKIEGGGGTTVNQKTSELFTLAAGTTAISLNIDLKDGNDILSVDSVQMLNATFEMGPGADNLSIKNSPAAVVTINADTSAANVAGADSVLLQNSNISTLLTCNLGPFNDTFSLSGSTVNSLNLQMGSGNDTATLAFSALTNLTVDGGVGTDTLVRTTSTVTNLPTILNVP